MKQRDDTELEQIILVSNTVSKYHKNPFEIT